MAYFCPDCQGNQFEIEAISSVIATIAFNTGNDDFVLMNTSPSLDVDWCHDSGAVCPCGWRGRVRELRKPFREYTREETTLVRNAMEEFLLKLKDPANEALTYDPLWLELSVFLRGEKHAA